MVAHPFKHQPLQLLHGHIILSRTTFLIPLGGAAAEILQNLSRVFADISRACLLHCRTTVSTEHLAGQWIDLSLSTAAGVLPQHLLHPRKALRINDSLMCARHNDPILFGQPDGLLGFIADLFMSALLQISRVRLIRQHAINRRLPPQVFVGTSHGLFVINVS